MGYDFKILKSVMTVNDIQRHILAKKIKAYFGENLKGKTIAVWGLAFKPNTDDIREAPALYIIQELLDAGAKITAFDPEAMPNVKQLFGDKITFVKEQYEALLDADALAIVTEWSIFRTPNFKMVGKLLKNKVIFDGRNLYDLPQMEEEGFYYDSIGRETVK